MTRLATQAGIFVPDITLLDSILMPTEGTPVITGTGTVTVDTVIKRNASPASTKHSSGASGGAAFQQWTFGLQGQFGYRARKYFNFSAQWPGNVGGNNKIILQLINNSGHFFAVRLVHATKKLRLVSFDGTTEVQQGSDSTTVLDQSKMYYIELYGKFGVGAGDDECAFKVSDASGASGIGTEETIGPITGLSISNIQLTGELWGFVDSADAGAQVNTCDGAINNDQGATQNLWCGQCINVLYSLPTADSARSANWLNGAAGTTNLWDAVNNKGPTSVADGSSTATTQIKNATTSDNTGNYDAIMQSYSDAGLTATQYVSLVQSLVSIGSSTTVNVSMAQLIVSNPVQGSEEANNTGRSASVGSFGSNWRSLWGTAQLFNQSNAPVPNVAPVLRIGRRSAVTEAGTLEVGLMFLPFEVQTIVPQVLTAIAHSHFGPF